VALLTLTPGRPLPDWIDAAAALCVLCGDRGTADALLNMVLFVPLGFVVDGRRGIWRAVLIGVGVSSLIEIAQAFLPGRYPTVGDIIWNGSGAGVGAATMALLRRFFGPGASMGPGIGRACAASAGAWLLFAGWLLGHSATNAAYYGQWTADLGLMPQYEGTLLSVRLDGLDVPDSLIPTTLEAPRRLASDWLLVTTLVAGPAPTSLAPIFSVYDAAEREILLLGVHGDDLVLRERMRARALRFDQPDMRFRGAFTAVPEGDTIVVKARRSGPSRCLSIDDEERCHLGVTPGRTWGLLLYLEGPPEWLRTIVDGAWMLALLLPVGLFSGSLRGLAANGLVVVVLTAGAAALTRLVLPPWWEVAAGCLGAVVGFGMGRAARVLVDSLRPS